MNNINKSLLVKLKEQNIDIDIQKYSKLLPKGEEKTFKIRNLNSESDFQSTATSGFRNNPSSVLSKQHSVQQSQLYEENIVESDNESQSEEIFVMNNDFKEIIQGQINDDLLEKLTSVDKGEFNSIHQLNIKFDSNWDSLQYAGQVLPNLVYLKLNNSIILSMRSLGTQMQNLKVIWIKNSKLEDLSGFNAFPQLQELYASYNNIKDLDPIMFHENLEILDLQGNDIESLDNFMYLETLMKLKELNLSENPIEKQDNFFSNLNLIQNLEIYNDQPLKNAINDNEKKNIPINQSFFKSAIIQEIDLQLMQEIQDEQLITQNIKSRVQSQQCDHGKQVAQIDNKQSSDLTNTGHIYVGNPLKVLKDKKTMKQTKELPNDIQGLISEFQQEYDDIEMKILEQELNRIQDKPLLKIRKPGTATKLISENIQKPLSTSQKQIQQRPILVKKDSKVDIMQKIDKSQTTQKSSEIIPKVDNPINQTLQKLSSNKLKFTIKPRIKNSPQ